MMGFHGLSCVYTWAHLEGCFVPKLKATKAMACKIQDGGSGADQLILDQSLGWW